ncbi:hypothetical protein MMC07_001144 [Pseudocyphellaria aurata]|nr:hypothetical protein [Pseudocyphellaria aurata]
MRSFKQKLSLRSTSRDVDAIKDRDHHTIPTGVRGSTSAGAQAKEESGPWGLKELCPGRDPILDIVAVHGLNGHREKTWTCHSEAGEDRGVLWLQDLLPKRIPRARVWTWGYDSRTHTRSHREYLTTKRLYEHGRELVFDLDSARRESNSYQRPIIFIAHSLGGIVVKSALLHSDRVREGKLEEQRSIKLSTYGIIFMGTPHQGGQGVGMGKMLLRVAKIQGDANDSLLKHLEEHSEFLEHQMSEFSLISQSFEMKFVYETKPTPLAGIIAQVIVPKWSAVIPGASDAAEFGIDADHRGMTKFPDVENEDFKKLSRILESMLGKSRHKVEANWALETCMKQVTAKILKRPFMVPFEKDSRFVGRMDIIAEIEQKLKSQRRVALAGIGGIGKSQIAIEYCYRFRDRYPDASVFWVHAGTVSRFKQAYEAIATEFGLGKDDPKTNALQLVVDWLNNEDNGNWLMILDNADDQAIFESTIQVTEDHSEQLTAMPLFRYLPQSQKGSIIVTTRDNRVGERLTFREKPIMVTFFDGPMAKTLLRSKLYQKLEWSGRDSDELVEALEFLPLAVTQAAAFICENNISVKEYTKILQASNSGISNILNHDLIDLRRDFDASSSVIRTWQVSFDQIRKQQPRAAELLSLMTVLDRQSVPMALLCGDYEEEIEIVTALGTLQAFSLINRNKEGKAFAMHRLVQLSTLKWLEMKNEKLKWQEAALRLLSANFPSGTDFANWKTCALYLPHVMVVVETLKLGADHANELGLLVETACYLQSQGQYMVAEQIIKQALQLYQSSYGDEHSYTLRCMKTLGEILTDEGKYKDAEKLLRKVLILSKSAPGESHKSTLCIASSLAIVLIRLGKYAEAKEMLNLLGFFNEEHENTEEEAQVQSLQTQREVLGAEHPHTLRTMAKLAVMYSDKKRWYEAEELQMQALRGQEEILGAEHPDTLGSKANLAWIYSDMNRWNEAEKLQMQALRGREKVLGAEHPSTLQSMADLVGIYSDMNRWDEAEKLQMQALRGHEKVLGAEHPDTLRTMANLAWIYSGMNRRDEAEKLQMQTLRGQEKVLGAEHPDTLRSMANLAVTYFNTDRWDEAEKLLMQALGGQKKILGGGHPSTLQSMATLAGIYSGTNRWDEAEKLQMQTLREQEMVLGAEHPDTLGSMANLAGIYSGMNRWDEAGKLRMQTLRGQEKVLGAEHPSTLRSMANLAVTYFNSIRWDEAKKLQQEATSHEYVLGAEKSDILGTVARVLMKFSMMNRWDEGEKLQLQALRGQEKILGAEHPDTLRSKASLAGIYSDTNRWDEAEKLQMQALRGLEEVLGTQHPDTLWSMADLAKTYHNMNQCEEAEKLQLQGFRGYEKVLGAEHPSTLRSMANLAVTYQKMNRWEEAENLQMQALRGHEKALGAGHPSTLRTMTSLAGIYSGLEKVLGAEHPDTLRSMTSLAGIYSGMNRWDEAEKLLMQALGGFEEVLGTQHPDTIWCMANLARMYYNMNRSEEAEKLQLQGLRGREKVLGAEHPHTLRSMADLAVTWKGQGHFDKAISLLSEAVRLSETALGAEHPDFKIYQRELDKWKKQCLETLGKLWSITATYFV